MAVDLVTLHVLGVPHSTCLPQTHSWLCALLYLSVCVCVPPQHLAFVKSLERRIDGARFTLNRHLQAALGTALAAGAWGPAGHCLRGFLELAEPGHAEEGLRQHLVGPLVRQVVTDVRQQQLQGSGQAAAAGAAINGAGSNGRAGSGGGSSPLSQVVSLSLSRLREQAGPLLVQLTGHGSGLGGIDLLGAVLLAELSTAVADGLPGEQTPCRGRMLHMHACQQLHDIAHMHVLFPCCAGRVARIHAQHV